MDSIFDQINSNSASAEPLASRMRPESLDDFAGCSDVLADGSYLRTAIENDKLSSLIVSGPPGCGKTTLAHIISKYTSAEPVSINAAIATLSTVKTELDKAENRLRVYGRRTLLFVDEIHRLNKLSQDALLPFSEKGTIILVGATTENPYYTLSNALLSRSRVIILKSLSEDDLVHICRRAIEDEEHGFGKRNISVSDEELRLIAVSAAGDARVALNILENCVELNSVSNPEGFVLTKEIVKANISKYALLYDKDGDYHYDTISAFIKSLRGSDPDAALFYLFTMLERGEDPLFIFRRMLILAAEDIGLADPNAITVVTSCKAAFEAVGLPEGEYHLSMAVLYLALTFKSSSVSCFYEAKAAAASSNHSVPLHLRNKGEGAKNYKYPHNYDHHYVTQQYLPDDIKSAVFYQPGSLGFEKKLKDLYEYRKSLDKSGGQA